MSNVQDYKCVLKKNNKVCKLNSSVFCSSSCLFRRNNYTFSVVSLGRLWNILYEKEQLQKKGSRISMPKLDHEMLPNYSVWRKFMTIQLISDPVRVLSIGRDSIQVLIIRSDPVRSGPASVNTPFGEKKKT